MTMVVTARLRPPDRIVEVADVRRVADLLARLEVLPGAVLVIRDGALLTSQDELRDSDKVEGRLRLSPGGLGDGHALQALRGAAVMEVQRRAAFCRDCFFHYGRPAGHPGHRQVPDAPATPTGC